MLNTECTNERHALRYQAGDERDICAAESRCNLSRYERRTEIEEVVSFGEKARQRDDLRNCHGQAVIRLESRSP